MDIQVEVPIGVINQLMEMHQQAGVIPTQDENLAQRGYLNIMIAPAPITLFSHTITFRIPEDVPTSEA